MTMTTRLTDAAREKLSRPNFAFLAALMEDDPHDHVDIRGRVVEIVEGEEAEEHIHRLGKKYRGWDRYPLQEASSA